jgi:hypothetical protein
MADRVLEFDSSPPRRKTTFAGPVPEGFEVVHERGAGDGARAGGRTVILRSASREKLLAAGADDPEAMAAGPHFAGWIEGGRTRHALIQFGDESWVLKMYRRGGVFGSWNPTRYWGCRRFLEELEVAAAALEQGVSTAEVLAVVFEQAGLGSVRSWSLTRYIPGVRPLHEYFAHAEEVAVFRAAGEAVQRMHAAGIDHPDLHIGNIVGSVGDGSARAHIIDWDRARVRRAGSWNPYANLVRLWRSVEKGRKKGVLGAQGSGKASYDVFAPAQRAFIRGYFRRRPGALGEARAYFRRRALWLGVRVWLGSARR